MKTQFLIISLLTCHFVVVVGDRVVKEFLVENGLEEDLEVAHETRVVSVLVLVEDRKKAEILLFLNGFALRSHREALGELNDSNDGRKPKHTSHSHL